VAVAEIRVDLGYLEQLASQLRALEAGFAEIDGRGDFDAAAVGDDVLKDRIDQFVSGWRDGRNRIKDRLTEAAELIEAALESYCGYEGHIAAGFRGDGS